MKLYIKQQNTFKQVITTPELAHKCKLTKQAIQKNKYIKPLFSVGQTDFYIYEDVQDFIKYQKAKHTFKTKERHEGYSK
jgi:hypothetical protein